MCGLIFCAKKRVQRGVMLIYKINNGKLIINQDGAVKWDDEMLNDGVVPLNELIVTYY